MINFLLWYLVVSYALGIILFAIELGAAFKRHEYRMMNFGLVILMLSPITTWHGLIHYGQVLYAKITKQPLKFWL
jgi:hypothetical protein